MRPQSSALPAWLVARVIVLAALGLAVYLVDQLGATPPMGRSRVGLTGWDASWYVRIADEGYSSLPRETLRFFPLLPLLARLPGLVIGHGAAVLLIANGAALGAGVLLVRLARFESGDRALSQRAGWFLALLPPAFTLVMGYAEPLFLVTTIAGFLFLREKRWLGAAACGFLAGLCRPIGVLFALPAAIEALRDRRTRAPGDLAGRVIAIAAPILGSSSYLAWIGWRFGDPLLPMRLQDRPDRRGSFVDPISSLLDAARDLANGELVGSGLHLPWAIAFLVLLAVLGRRWPASYTVFAGAVLLVALSAENLDSLERYGLSAFPFVLALAGLTSHPWAERAVLAACGGGLAAYSLLAFLSAYVP